MRLVQPQLAQLSVFVTDADGSPVISATAHQVGSGWTHDTEFSLGPTDSGADKTWPALDAVPPGVDWIAVRISIGKVNPSSNSTTTLWMWKNGETGGKLSANSLATIMTDDGEKDIFQAYVVLPVDEAVRLKGIWKTTSLTGTDAITLWLTGYGWNLPAP